MPAGFQCEEFVRHHLSTAILTGNIHGFEAAMYANPFAVYNVDLGKICEEETELNQCCVVIGHPMKVKKDAVVRLRQNSDADISILYHMTEERREVAPSLKQLVVFTNRRHPVGMW